MAKRILALILALCLCVGLLPTAHAWDEDIGLSKVSIMTWQKSYRVLEVYTDGSEFFMTPAQLSWLSEFTYTEGNICTFTRGGKTVNVDTDHQLIYMAGATHGIYLPAACRQIGGSWYLPASGVLPWLNTHCAEDAGVLKAFPNPVSVWDTTDVFRLTDYNFDLFGICSSIGISPLSLTTASFVIDHGIGSLGYLVPDMQGSSMGEELDYYDLFSDMIKDVSATDHAANDWLKRYDDFGKDLEAYSTAIGFLSPTMGEATDAQYITYTKNAMDIFIYCALFDQDGANKTDILQTLVNGADSSSNSGMVSAANDVIREYSSIWDGIYNKVEHHVVNGLYDGLTSGTVLGLLGYAAQKIRPSKEQVARIGKYQNLMAEALDGYNCYRGETTLLHLQEYVNFIQLYLYSSEQNHRAMLAHMKDCGQENTDAYTQCQQRADMIEQQLSYFIHISAFLEDDCSDRDYKDSATEELLKIFEGVDPDAVPRGITVAAEQAIYRAAMEDMGVLNITHDVTDMDGDGERELLVVCDDTWEDWPSFIVVDPNNYIMGSYTDTFNTYSRLRQTPQGQYRVFRKYEDLSGNPNETLVWTDMGFVFEGADMTLQETSLPNPNLTEQSINGDTKALLQQLDTYFGCRPDCVGYSYDLNADGSNDRIYLLINAADLWTKLCQVTASFGGERHLDYDDDKVTLLTAETQPTGVLLRVCRLDFHGRPDDIILSKADRTITADSYIYSYQPTGEPFVCQQIPQNTLCAADLMGLTREQLQQVVESYTEDSETTAYGYCQGGYLSMTYTDGVLTHLSVSSWNGEAVPLIDGIYTGNTLLEMLENAYSMGDWTNLEPMGAYYYTTSSSYRDSSGNNYIFTAAFTGTTMDSVLHYATFTLC